MPLQLINLDDLEREFCNRAAHLMTPPAKQWLVTVPKDYLLNVNGDLDETDMRENFAQYNREWKRLYLDGVPDVLPEWVETAVQQGSPVFVFDAVETRRHAFWERKIQHIVNWFNSKPTPKIDWNTLTFEDALRRANDWYRQNGLR